MNGRCWKWISFVLLGQVNGITGAITHAHEDFFFLIDDVVRLSEMRAGSVRIQYIHDPDSLLCMISWCCQSICASVFGCDWWISKASWFLSKYFPHNVLHKLPDIFISSFWFFCLKFSFLSVLTVPPTVACGHIQCWHKIALFIPVQQDVCFQLN